MFGNRNGEQPSDSLYGEKINHRKNEVALIDQRAQHVTERLASGQYNKVELGKEFDLRVLRGEAEGSSVDILMVRRNYDVSGELMSVDDCFILERSSAGTTIDYVVHDRAAERAFLANLSSDGSDDFVELQRRSQQIEQDKFAELLDYAGNDAAPLDELVKLNQVLGSIERWSKAA